MTFIIIEATNISIIELIYNNIIIHSLVITNLFTASYLIFTIKSKDKTIKKQRAKINLKNIELDFKVERFKEADLIIKLLKMKIK